MLVGKISTDLWNHRYFAVRASGPRSQGPVERQTSHPGLPQSMKNAQRRMRLVIMRHGRAKDRAEWQAPDAMRPLTAEGRKRTRAVAQAVAPLIGELGMICSSPWLRALATAEIAGKAWNLPVEEHHWLAGEGFSARDRLDRLPHEDIALVGHEPDLGELIGLLTGGPDIPLRKAGIAVLTGQPFDGGMRLELLLTPAAILGVR